MYYLSITWLFIMALRQVDCFALSNGQLVLWCIIYDNPKTLGFRFAFNSFCWNTCLLLLRQNDDKRLQVQIVLIYEKAVEFGLFFYTALNHGEALSKIITLFYVGYCYCKDSGAKSRCERSARLGWSFKVSKSILGLYQMYGPKVSKLWVSAWFYR